MHQFSTQTKDLNCYRLSRHWYDVDCLLTQKIADPINTRQAMADVVEMKKLRWAEKGVDFDAVLHGNLQLVPCEERLTKLAADHQTAVDGQMFFSEPSDFNSIINRIQTAQNLINANNK